MVQTPSCLAHASLWPGLRRTGTSLPTWQTSLRTHLCSGVLRINSADPRCETEFESFPYSGSRLPSGDHSSVLALAGPPNRSRAGGYQLLVVCAAAAACRRRRPRFPCCPWRPPNNSLVTISRATILAKLRDTAPSLVPLCPSPAPYMRAPPLTYGGTARHRAS